MTTTPCAGPRFSGLPSVSPVTPAGLQNCDVRERSALSAVARNPVAVKESGVLKQIDMWRWRVFDPQLQKWVDTSYLMSEQLALYYPGSTKIEGTHAVMRVAASDEEADWSPTSAFVRTSPG